MPECPDNAAHCKEVPDPALECRIVQAAVRHVCEGNAEASEYLSRCEKAALCIAEPRSIAFRPLIKRSPEKHWNIKFLREPGTLIFRTEVAVGQEETINFNGNLNEDPENIYSVYYPTVARRVVEKKVSVKLPASADNTYTLNFRPLDPGIVLEKIVVNYGGYQPSYLFGNESPCKRK